MQPFNYQTAHDESSALSLQEKSQNSRYLAGGTSLVDLMKLHVEVPTQLVDISSVAQKSVHDAGKSVQIGAPGNQY